MGSPPVLYVEDEKFDVLFMERAFAKAGLAGSLHVVTDGQQAIHYLAGEALFQDRTRYPLPSLILLDLNLPLVSGFDVLRWLRNHPSFAATPVVIFSSSARSEDKQTARLLGASDYLEKPASGIRFAVIAEQLKQRWFPNAAPLPPVEAKVLT
jgi:CheY-like chemotaxis protein